MPNATQSRAVRKHAGSHSPPIPATAMNTPPPAEAFSVRIVNGNLRFTRRPILLGHYRAMALTGTERAMDELIGGTMEEALSVGHYPSAPGTHAVFLNTRRSDPFQSPRPPAVVVVGLGDEGTLRAADLSRTVTRGVIAWAQRVLEREDRPAEGIELAATLIGSGGTGVSAGQAASLLVNGVLAANLRLATLGWPTVSLLELVELYHDRATEAWHTLRGEQSDGDPGYHLAEEVSIGNGALRRPFQGGYRGTSYDLITAVTITDTSAREAISYVVDTRRARTEAHAQTLQRPLIQELVADGATDTHRGTSTGRTMFRLLVPVELEPHITSSTEAVIELDQGTAGIPWELLDDVAEDAPADTRRPWALRAKLLRKLRTAGTAPRLADAPGDANALVIGEPACDPERYPRLPGARTEAATVAETLEGAPGFEGSLVKGLYSPTADGIGPSAQRVIRTLLEQDWRVIHIAGHGAPPAEGASPGVVLSDNILLSTSELSGLRTAPDLVFVNCCHLGASDSDDLLRAGAVGGPFDRVRFAASVAESLVKAGVRCVVAAGWAVEDQPARTFAARFYDALAQGQRFMDAVAAAREAAFEMGGNTWAAYQCYGDPEWRLCRGAGGSGSASLRSEPASAELSSTDELVLTLDTLATESRFDGNRGGRLAETLSLLERRFAARWGDRGAVAEAFGAAWAACHRGRAIRWYRRALAAGDGGSSLRAAEQLGNLRTRRAWTAARRRSAAKRGASARVLDIARREIRDALSLLESLADRAGSTVERESLCGSAWKRLAMLEALAGRPDDELHAFTEMERRYARAEERAREIGDPDLFYPALNRIAARLVSAPAGAENAGIEPASVEAARSSLQAKDVGDPDFWSFAGGVELRMYEAVAGEGLAGALDQILNSYAQLHTRMQAPWNWASVRDQAHMVLSRYAVRATEAESTAAATLLARLGGYAQPDAPA